MAQIFFVLGCLFAFVGVAAGAFGAHGLKTVLSADLLTVFETGVRYQMYHAFGLFVVAWTAQQSSQAAAWVSMAGWLFVAGIVLFSGSLYLVSLSGVRWMGAFTPVGGVALLAGWLTLAWGVWKA